MDDKQEVFDVIVDGDVVANNVPEDSLDDVCRPYTEEGKDTEIIHKEQAED